MQTLLVQQDGDKPVGVVRKYPRGWLFLSHVSGHANGRKYRNTAEQAVPKWVGDFELASQAT